MRMSALLLAGLLVACGTASTDDTPDAGHTNEETIVEVTADVTANTTWSASKTYVLRKYVFVKGATLTIEPGTRILGASETALVVTSSARLVAAGRANAPIVFTSSKAEGDRAKGDWGGVVLLGKARINVEGGAEYVEGFPAGESDDTKYGGTDDAHDCGRLEFVRIEFAGFQLAPDNELNGLTVAACGTGTKIDHLQVHKGADDGVEFFGGTASLRHVIVSQPDDDGLDWDFGWTGTVQFLVVQQNGVVGDFGIEADNNKDRNDATPRSLPTIWNMTLVGSNKEPGSTKRQGGILFRRGTGAHIHNSIVTGFADYAIDVGDANTGAVATAGDLYLKNSILFDNANLNDTFPADIQKTDANGTPIGPNDGTFDEEAHFTGEATNRFVDPQLTGAFALAAPSFVPATASPIHEGGATPPTGFDATATFVGAFGTTDWSAGWTAYPAD